MSRKYASDYKGIPPEKVEQMELTHKHKNKSAAIGMKQREGNIIVIAVDNTKSKTIGDTVKANVATDAVIGK